MDIIGHQKEREYLRKLAMFSEHPQSFLFSGPENIGKRAVALEFAWMLLGRESDFSDRLETDLSHPDIVLLEPERITEKGKMREKNIPVEAVRESMHFLSRYPLVGRKRILIIDDAHRLSHGAQNALLKVLEEPNSTSILILITHRSSVLLDTVSSRLQRVRFSLVAKATMQEFDGGDDEEILLSLGRPGIMKTMLENPGQFSSQVILLKRLDSLSETSLSERMTLAEDFSREGERIARPLEWWILRLRQRALTAPTIDETRMIYRLLDRIIRMQELLFGTQANARLQLEKLFLNIP